MRTKDRLAEGALPEPVPQEDRIALRCRRDREHVAARRPSRRHGTPFQEQLRALRRAAELAQAFGRLAQDAWLGALTDATAARVEQMVMEQVFQMCLATPDVQAEVDRVREILDLPPIEDPS